MQISYICAPFHSIRTPARFAVDHVVAFGMLQQIQLFNEADLPGNQQHLAVNHPQKEETQDFDYFLLSF